MCSGSFIPLERGELPSVQCALHPSRPQRVNTSDTLEWRVLIHKICDIIGIRMVNLIISSLGDEGLSCTLCKLHPGRVKGSPHTG